MSRTADRAEKSHRAGAEGQKDEAKARISGTVDGDTTGLADFTTMLGDGGL